MPSWPRSPVICVRAAEDGSLARRAPPGWWDAPCALWLPAYNNGMKMTRRKLAGMIAAPALLSRQASAQAPAAASNEVSAARGEFQSAARQLAALKIARSVEPAARFEA